MVCPPSLNTHLCAETPIPTAVAVLRVSLNLWEDEISTFTFNSVYPLFLGRQIGIKVALSNLLSWKEGARGFQNLKNSNPSSLVHDGVVKAEYGNVIVIPLSLSALTGYLEIWMSC